MKLSQISGWNPSRKGFWTHVVPDDGQCVAITPHRMLVVRASGDDYFLHDDGTIELAKAYPKVYQDND